MSLFRLIHVFHINIYIDILGKDNILDNHLIHPLYWRYKQIMALVKVNDILYSLITKNLIMDNILILTNFVRN